MLTLPLFNTSLQYLCPTVDTRHRSACLVSALHECPHWRVFGDLLRLTHCIRGTRRCQLCQPPRCAGHLTAATWGAAPATTPAPGTGWSGGTLTQPRLFLRALIKYLNWNQFFFFTFGMHIFIHTQMQNIVPLSPIWASVRQLGYVLPCWSNFHTIANSTPDFDFVDQSYYTILYIVYTLHIWSHDAFMSEEVSYSLI